MSDNFGYLENENESDREKPDALICDSLSFSDEFLKDIKVESENEEASNVSSSRELQQNQSNNDAEFISEDGEYFMETLSSIGPSKTVSKLSQGSPLNTKEVLEKTVPPVPSPVPDPSSNRYQPVEELNHVNLPKDSKFHNPKNEIKLDYEETSNFNVKQEHLCNEVQESQTNDYAGFISEDEHSVESSHVTSTNDSKVCRVQRITNPKNYNLTLDIIKMWKKYPCLWDRNCDYCTQKKRNKTWDTIRHSLKQKWNCEIPKDTFLRKILSLRKQYDQGVRNRRKATTSKDVRVPWFFKELSFLGPRTYNCEECDKAFRSEFSFNHHICAHEGIACYVCNVCNKEYASVFLLRKHNKTHHDVVGRPCECKICGQKFPIKYQLSVHLRQHRKENYFV